jgi:CheY-like chemotaxis protein
MEEKTFTILVAEDECFQRLGLIDLLTMCGYQTIPVENGKQAMVELENELNDIDLVLLDLQMPEMDGFEVL